MNTEYLSVKDAAGEEALCRAAEIIKNGGLVAIPTETVYGLGASALNDEAVARICTVKGRPQDNPLIIHVHGSEALKMWCSEVPEAAYKLAEKFWPGPLTMVLKKKNCARMKLPILLFQAERDDYVLPGGQDRFIAAVPNGRIIFVPGVKHEIYMSGDAVMKHYLQAIMSFLNR